MLSLNLLYAYVLVLMSETIEEFMNNFLKLKEALKVKGVQDNLRKTKVMVSAGIRKDG